MATIYATQYNGYLSYTSQNGSSKNFQRGSQKQKEEMKEKKTINIPLSAYNLQIVKNKQGWTFQYNLSSDRSVQIVVNHPCTIDRMYKENDRLHVVLNIYTPQEFVTL